MIVITYDQYHVRGSTGNHEQSRLHACNCHSTFDVPLRPFGFEEGSPVVSIYRDWSDSQSVSPDLRVVFTHL